MLLIVFFASFIGTHLVQMFFLEKNKIDTIEARSSHEGVATLTGGISVFLILTISSLWSYMKGVETFDFSIMIPLSIMFIVGVYDDFYLIDYKLKFIMQAIVAKIIIDMGFVIDNYHGLFGLYDIPWLLAQLSTLFVFLVVVNAINFIDGIDGLALTECIKTLLLFLGFTAASTPFDTLIFWIIAAMTPLYYFNFRKQKKVFLGDAGSLLLGTVICLCLFYALSPAYQLISILSINKVIFTIGLVLYPLIDVLRVFILRIKNGKSPFLPDKNHLHHLLLVKTGSHGLTVVGIQLISLFVILCIFFVFR